jgi:hypothetical protein
MSYEIKGKLIEKYEPVQVTDRFRKREFVIEYRENAGSSDFVENIKFQLTQDRCDLVDRFKLGEDVKINFNIRGRRWEKDGNVSYFNNLEAWKIESDQTAQAIPEPPPPHSIEDIPPEPTDDLPF